MLMKGRWGWSRWRRHNCERLSATTPNRRLTPAGSSSSRRKERSAFAEVIRLIRSGDEALAREQIKGENGPELMKQIRAEMGTFTQEEERLGAGRRQVLEMSWQRLSWLLVAGTAAAILLASILTLLFSGGISGRLQQLRDNAISLAAGKELAPPLPATMRLPNWTASFMTWPNRSTRSPDARRR